MTSDLGVDLTLFWNILFFLLVSLGLAIVVVLVLRWARDGRA
jgi:hypothetical protein